MGKICRFSNFMERATLKISEKNGVQLDGRSTRQFEERMPE